MVFMNVAAKFFPKEAKMNPRPHSSPDPSCGREIQSRQSEKSFPPEKRFSFCRVRIEAPRTARILEGRTPKEKHPFLFQKKFAHRQKRYARSVFSFGVAGVSASAWASSFVQFPLEKSSRKG